MAHQRLYYSRVSWLLTTCSLLKNFNIRITLSERRNYLCSYVRSKGNNELQEDSSGLWKNIFLEDLRRYQINSKIWQCRIARQNQNEIPYKSRSQKGPVISISQHVSVSNINVRAGDDLQVYISPVSPVAKPISQDRSGEGNQACKYIYWHRQEIRRRCPESQLSSNDKPGLFTTARP
jgi:hypothetical protein